MKFLTIIKTFDEIKETAKMLMIPVYVNDNKYGVWIPKKCLYESNDSRDKHRNYLYLTKNFTFNAWNFDTKTNFVLSAQDMVKWFCAENIEAVLKELESGK